MGGFTSVSKSPAGTVEWFAGSAAPAGYLSCNGAAVSRTTYAALFLAISTTYGAGNGSTTFNIPDLRGEFIRGLDNGRGIDTGRGIGTAQGGQFGSHTHGQSVSNSNAGGTGMPAASNGALLNQTSLTEAQGGTSNSNETRPRNVAMLPCIKF